MSDTYDKWKLEGEINRLKDEIEALRDENARLRKDSVIVLQEREIKRLCAEIVRLREALKPFADEANVVEAAFGKNPPNSIVSVGFQNLRADRAAMGLDNINKGETDGN